MIQMMNRIWMLILAAVFAGMTGQCFAQTAEYMLRYEAKHFAKLLQVTQHHVINERFDAKELNVAIFAYRLDQRSEQNTMTDSALFSTSKLVFDDYFLDSMEENRQYLLSLPMARVMANHRVKFLGTVDTIAGLPSYQYSIESEGSREYLVWLAEAPKGLENLLLWQSLEYQERKGSFLLDEELCNVIRLILLRNASFPPKSESPGKPFIITRYDTAVNPDYLNARDNSYLYELKRLTVEASTVE